MRQTDGLAGFGGFTATFSDRVPVPQREASGSSSDSQGADDGTRTGPFADDLQMQMEKRMRATAAVMGATFARRDRDHSDSDEGL